MHPNYPAIKQIADKRERFARLDSGGWLDFSSGTWNHDRNEHPAKCGRCGSAVPKRTGCAYNEILSDGCRTVTRFLCPNCETDYTLPFR